MGQNRLSVRATAILALAVLAALACTSVFAEPPTKPKRARPPKWTADVRDAFFEDAREKLEGQRPNYGAGHQTPRENVVASAREKVAPGHAWSKLIDAETVETEIKRMAQAVSADVTTPSEFKGGKYQDCRRHFSVLAMLFAVAAEYDGNVRWQDVAAGLRDVFARAGYNCKVGTDATYREAMERKAELAEVVAGSRPQVPMADRMADWSHVADRPPLMQRMNIAHEERLTKWLASERQFPEHHDEVRHEAQLVAAIADVIGREGFEYWDDEQYAAYARELRQAA